MSSNPHNQKLTNIFSKLAKKVVHSSNSFNHISINELKTKPIKDIIKSNHTLDNFLSLYKPNVNLLKSNSYNKDNNKSQNTLNFSKCLSDKNTFINSNCFLNKKRNFIPQKDEKLYKQQVKKKEIEKRKNLLEQKEN